MRQTESLITSVIRLLEITLPAPDYRALSRRPGTLKVPRPRPQNEDKPLHLFMESTGLELCGAGKWHLGRHVTKIRHFWKKLHISMNTDTGQIIAAA